MAETYFPIPDADVIPVNKIPCRIRREEGKRVMTFPLGAPMDDDFIKRALDALSPAEVSEPSPGYFTIDSGKPYWERRTFISEITLFDNGQWSILGYEN